MFYIKQRVLAIERSTNQHTWYQQSWRGVSAIVHQVDDAELSKRAHGLNIEVVVTSRKIEVISLWTDLLLGIFKKSDTESIRSLGDIYVGNSRSREHVEALEAQVKMQRLDLDFLDRRVAIQIVAVSPRPPPYYPQLLYSFFF